MLDPPSQTHLGMDMTATAPPLFEISCECGHTFNAADLSVITCPVCGQSMLSLAEAARKAGVSRTTIQNRLAAGLLSPAPERIPNPVGGGSLWMIAADFVMKPPRKQARPRPTKAEPAPYPCAICGDPVPARTALVQFGQHPGKREYWPRCPFHVKRIAYHVQRFRESLAAMQAAVADGVDDEP